MQRGDALRDARRPGVGVTERRCTVQPWRRVAGDARGVVDLGARQRRGRGFRRGDSGGRCGRELGVPEQQHMTHGLDARADGRDHGRVGRYVLALGVDRDSPREKEQAGGDAHQDADHEHEAVEELLVLMAQRLSSLAESGAIIAIAALAEIVPGRCYRT